MKTGKPFPGDHRSACCSSQASVAISYLRPKLMKLDFYNNKFLERKFKTFEKTVTNFFQIHLITKISKHTVVNLCKKKEILDFHSYLVLK